MNVEWNVSSIDRVDVSNVYVLHQMSGQQMPVHVDWNVSDIDRVLTSALWVCKTRQVSAERVMRVSAVTSATLTLKTSALWVCKTRWVPEGY